MPLPALFAISLLGDAISIVGGLLIFALLLLLVEGLDRV